MTEEHGNVWVFFLVGGSIGLALTAFTVHGSIWLVIQYARWWGWI